MEQLNEEASCVTQNLYFLDGYGRARLLRENVSEERANKAIQEFLDAHNFKSYYQRRWGVVSSERRGVMIDVGSHAEFFFFGEIWEEQWS